MGDIGEYWKEHKEYKRRVASGISRSQERRIDKEFNEIIRQNKLDKCTIQCECGKWLLDTNAHNSHKMVRGKAGHNVKQTKKATVQEECFVPF